ncbi:DUF4468 domain-containing protein [bacterium]|nr:DUF4468 domain-containing protein [bacterium]
MRKLLQGGMPVLVALLLFGCAAQRTASPEAMRHEARMHYPDRSDAQIYNAVKSWVLAHCEWDGDILQFEDTAQHALMARGVWKRASEYAPMLEVDIEYTLSVEIDKGEAFFQLSRLAAMSADEKHEEMTFYSNSEKFHEDVETRFQEMIGQLDFAIQNSE